MQYVQVNLLCWNTAKGNFEHAITLNQFLFCQYISRQMGPSPPTDLSCFDLANKSGDFQPLLKLWINMLSL